MHNIASILSHYCRMFKRYRKTTLSLLLLAITLVGLWLKHLCVPLPPCNRNWDRQAPVSAIAKTGTCRFNVSVYLDDISYLKYTYPDFEKDTAAAVGQCVLPHGAKCIVQASDAKSDVLFRAVADLDYPLLDRFMRYMRTVTRHCEGQLLAVLSSEAVNTPYQHWQLNLADIRIDYHLSSDILFSEKCFLPLAEIKHRPPPEPSTRKGIAMFVSNCKPTVEWRNKYLKELMLHVHIDSYGKCFHNVPEEAKEGTSGSKFDSFREIAKNYRMVVIFENVILADYITEKIRLVYDSGAIPVYWGPPQVYAWAPGNHSFIDASAFSGPKELADYLKRVDTEDALFRYHTTNFDIEKSRAMVDKWCTRTEYMCSLCKLAYEKKAKLCNLL